MESRIKDADLRNAGHQLAAGLDTDQVCRVVKRRKFIALFNLFQNLIGKKRRGGKFLTSVNHTMAYRADFA